MAFEVNGHHLIPIRLRERSKHAVAVVARVVHNTGQVTEGIDRLSNRLTTALVIGNVRLVHHSKAACGSDLVDHRASRLGVDIVDEYRRALTGEHTRVRCTQAATRSSDDNNALITNSHCSTPRDARVCSRLPDHRLRTWFAARSEPRVAPSHEEASSSALCPWTPVGVRAQ